MVMVVMPNVQAHESHTIASHYCISLLQREMYVKPNDAHNLLRPETAESLFIMYRLTKVLTLLMTNSDAL